MTAPVSGAGPAAAPTADRLDQALTVAIRRDVPAGAVAQELAGRVFSPLAGIVTDVTRLVRSRYGPQMFLYSGELTGVHLWSSRADPPPGSFHLGGFGLHQGEALVKLLGEAVERYSGHAAVAAGRFPVRMASLDELAAEQAATLDAADLEWFRPDQFATPGFPFAPFRPDAPLGWVQARSLLSGRPGLVPAQLLLLGYLPSDQEPWLQTAVTTGTAVHPDPGRALQSALEEVVQVDAAIGHWHGQRPGWRILPGPRTAALDRIIARATWKHAPAPEFHLLPSPDLPGFNVACLLRAPGQAVPRVAVGLGAGARLQRAMYRAFLEAVGVTWLAAWVQIRAAAPQPDGATGSPYDLESNVGFYAAPAGAAVVEDRFAASQDLAAEDLPPDEPDDPRRVVARLCEAFARSGHRVFHADLSTVDVRRLGLSAQRVWSPDLLALPFPGAPPLAHRRWAAYGGVGRDDPHPYP